MICDYWQINWWLYKESYIDNKEWIKNKKWINKLSKKGITRGEIIFKNEQLNLFE